MLYFKGKSYEHHYFEFVLMCITLSKICSENWKKIVFCLSSKKYKNGGDYNTSRGVFWLIQLIQASSPRNITDPWFECCILCFSDDLATRSRLPAHLCFRHNFLGSVSLPLCAVEFTEFALAGKLLFLDFHPNSPLFGLGKKPNLQK